MAKRREDMSPQERIDHAREVGWSALADKLQQIEDHKKAKER